MLTLALLGILFTIVFGIPGIIAFLRRYETKLVFIQEDLINLYDKVVKNIEGLKITYKKKPINEYIYLLRGVLFCLGKRDITREQIEKYLYFKIPKNSIWHDYKIISKTEDLKIDLKIEKEKLILKLGLFKDGEFLYLDGLFESHDPQVKENLITISHRIANIGKVKRYELSYYKNRFIPLFLPLTIFLVIFSQYSNSFFHSKVQPWNLSPVFYKGEQQVQLPPDSSLQFANLQSTRLDSSKSLLSREQFDSLVSLVKNNYFQRAKRDSLKSLVSQDLLILKNKITRTEKKINILEKKLKVLRLQEKAAREHKYFDLVFNKNIKEYKLDDVYSVKFYLKSKFDLYVFVITSLILLIVLSALFFYFLDYLSIRKILNMAKCEIEKGQKKHIFTF